MMKLIIMRPMRKLAKLTLHAMQKYRAEIVRDYREYRKKMRNMGAPMTPSGERLVRVGEKFCIASCAAVSFFTIPVLIILLYCMFVVIIESVTKIDAGIICYIAVALLVFTVWLVLRDHFALFLSDIVRNRKMLRYTRIIGDKLQWLGGALMVADFCLTQVRPSSSWYWFADPVSWWLTRIMGWGCIVGLIMIGLAELAMRLIQINAWKYHPRNDVVNH